MVAKLQMDKLTKEQKIEFINSSLNKYKEMLSDRDIRREGLCDLLFDYVFGLTHDVYINILDFIPELADSKPDKNPYVSLWFPLNDEGLRKRIDILEKLLNNLQKKEFQ